MKALFVLGILSYAIAARAITIEAYGDSLTAGFFSNEKGLTSPPPLKEISKTLSDLSMFLITGNPAYREPYEYRDRAWPHVLARHLSGFYNAEVADTNFGQVSAITADLPKQMENLEWGTVWRSMAFVFIGHNDLDDVAAPTPDALAEKHRGHLNDFLAKWDAKHYQSTLFFVPVGEVYRVFQNLKGFTWFKNESVTYRCEESWQRFFPYANFYYQLMKQGKLDSFLVPRVAALQNEQREAARRWNSRSQRNNYRFLELKRPFTYTPKNFAIDCFHLSQAGEAEMAQTVFETLIESRFGDETTGLAQR